MVGFRWIQTWETQTNMQMKERLPPSVQGTCELPIVRDTPDIDFARSWVCCACKKENGVLFIRQEHAYNLTKKFKQKNSQPRASDTNYFSPSTSRLCPTHHNVVSHNLLTFPRGILRGIDKYKLLYRFEWERREKYAWKSWTHGSYEVDVLHLQPRRFPLAGGARNACLRIGLFGNHRDIPWSAGTLVVLAPGERTAESAEAGHGAPHGKHLILGDNSD